MEESLSLELRTYQLCVTIALIFFVLNFVYLLFVLFTVLKTRVRSSSMLVKCTTTEQHL